MKKLFCAGLFAMLATAGFAHSPLKATTPADQGVLSQAPAEITMTFMGNIRLTRVTLTDGAETSRDLDLSGQTGFVSDYTIPLETLTSDTYIITWRGLGDDGHALNGTFGFTVQ